jgi:hypothetical protein
LGLGCNQDPGAGVWTADSGASGDTAVDVGPDGGETDVSDADTSIDAADSGPDTNWYDNFCRDYDHHQTRDRLDFHVNQTGNWKLALDRGTNYRPLELPERMSDSIVAATFREPDTIDKWVAGFIISMPVEEGESWRDLWMNPQKRIAGPDGTPTTISTLDEIQHDNFGHPYDRSLGQFEVSRPQDRVELKANELRTIIMTEILGLTPSDEVDWPTDSAEYPGSSPIWYSTAIYREAPSEDAGRLIILGAIRTVNTTGAGTDILRAVSPRAVGPASASVETTCEIRRAHQAPDIDVTTFVSNGMSEDVQSTAKTALGDAVAQLRQVHWVDPRFAVMPMGEAAPLPTEDIDWLTERDDVEGAFARVTNSTNDAEPKPIKRASRWHSQAGSDLSRYLFLSSRLQPRSLTEAESDFLSKNRVLAMEPSLTDCGSGIFDGRSLYDEYIQRPMSHRRFLFHTCAASPNRLAAQVASLHAVPKEERAYRLPGRLAGDSLTIYPNIPLDASPRNQDGNAWLETDSSWLRIVGPLRPDWPVDDEIERIGFTYLKWSNSEETP